LLPAVKGIGTVNSKSLVSFFHQSKITSNLPLKNVPSKPMFVGLSSFPLSIWVTNTSSSNPIIAEEFEPVISYERSSYVTPNSEYWLLGSTLLELPICPNHPRIFKSSTQVALDKNPSEESLQAAEECREYTISVIATKTWKNHHVLQHH